MGANGQTSTRDIKTFANHAFVVADTAGHGMQVFDLTRLRGVESPQSFEPDALYLGKGASHNLSINEETGYAYLVAGGGAEGCELGLHVIDISTPKSPAMAGCWGDTGRIHDTQCVIYRGPDQDYQGAEICFASNHPNLSIINVSDKGNISLLGQESWPDAGFAHQGWLSEDQRYFVMGDEADEGEGRNTRTIVIDVSNLQQPVYVGAHLADTLATDHNQYIKGNFLYQANYSVGLRILRIDDLATAAFTEVAWFDTYPLDDVNGLGAWNVYPFFDNGTLLVSDLPTGLFMLRARVGNEFRINAGLNDAWVNSGAALQGMFITVFPELKIIFLAWFTFDSEQPAGDVTAVFGAPDQRWVTAVGSYAGSRAELTAELTSGGAFNSSDPLPVQETSYGTINLEFFNCNAALVEFDFPSAGQSGEFNIQRAVDSNLALCEALKGE
jgi:choice-of-anchor B domain-containing protein